MDSADTVNEIGASMVILFIIMSLFFCKNCFNRDHPGPRTHTHTPAEEVSITIEQGGLNEETLRSFPKVLYSQAKLHKTNHYYSNCSICLGEYRDEDTLRLLPNCGHVFHLKCVDTWLRLHTTCPICRNSPLPSHRPHPFNSILPAAEDASSSRLSTSNLV